MSKDLKRWIWLALVSLAIVFCLVPAVAEETVQLNEIMLSTATFESGKAYEWVELHNPTGVGRQHPGLEDHLGAQGRIPDLCLPDRQQDR